MALTFFAYLACVAGAAGLVLTAGWSASRWDWAWVLAPGVLLAVSVGAIAALVPLVRRL